MASEVLLHADRLIDDLLVALEALRAENEGLRALAESRGDDAATAQMIVRQAIHVMHHDQLARRRQRALYERLREENRELRARLRAEETKAA
jgi:hypothetical protein